MSVQFVYIQGVQRENYPGVWRAGRFWPSAHAQRVEVLNQDEDPEQEEVDVFEAGKKVGTKKVASTKKIGRKTFESLKKDPRVRILADGETDAVTSAAVLKQAREAQASAEEKLAAAQKENAELKEQLAAVSEELAAFQLAANDDSKGKSKKSKD